MVVDGFADFTRTEHEILALLTKHVESLYISLPLDPDSDRTDLFAKSRQTLQRLEDYPGGCKHEPLPANERPAWPTLAHLERELFGNPRHLKVAQDPQGVTIRIASRALGEIETIGREIKTLLLDGDNGRTVSPAEIVVVFRSLSEAAPQVREVFAGLGLPFTLEASVPLGQSRVLAALAAVLQLDRSDWPFRRLLAVLGNNYFQPIWPAWQKPGAAVATERTLRALQIASGREYLLAQVARWASVDLAAFSEPDAEDEDEQQRRQQFQRRHADAQLALAVLQELDRSLGALPQRRPLPTGSRRSRR